MDDENFHPFRIIKARRPNGSWGELKVNDQDELLVDANIQIDNINVDITDKLKNTDIASATDGNYTGINPWDAPATPVALTQAQIDILFDGVCSTASSIPLANQHGIKFVLKCPQSVYDVEFVDEDGKDIEGQIYPIYADDNKNQITPVGDRTALANAQRFPTQDKVSAFIFVNRSGASVNLSEVIARTFNAERVFAEVEAPLNTNNRNEIVLEDLDTEDEYTTLNIGGVLYPLKDNVELWKRLFDKNGVTYIGNITNIQLRFKQPQCIAEVCAYLGDKTPIATRVTKTDIYGSMPSSYGNNHKIYSVIKQMNIYPQLWNGTMWVNQSAPISTLKLTKYSEMPNGGVYYRPKPTTDEQYYGLDDFTYDSIVDDINLNNFPFLFDRQASSDTFVTITEAQTMDLKFKSPSYVKDIRMYQHDGAPTYNLNCIYTITRWDNTTYTVTTDHLIVNDIIRRIQAVPEGSQPSYQLTEILVSRYSHRQVYSPTNEPTNVKVMQEVQIDDIDLQNTTVNRSGTVYTAGEVFDNFRRLFDKQWPLSFPQFRGINLVFNRPINVDFVKFVNNTTGGPVITDGASAWQYDVYFSDGTVYQESGTEEKTLHWEHNKQVSRIIFTYGANIGLGELLITTYHTQRISSSPTDVVYVAQGLPTSQFKYSDEAIQAIPAGAVGVAIAFNFTARHWRIRNDHNTYIEYKFGLSAWAKLQTGEAITDDDINQTAVTIRSGGGGAGGEKYRIWAW